MICWIKCVTGSYCAPTDADCSAIRNISCGATGEALAGSESAQAWPKSTKSVFRKQTRNYISRKRIQCLVSEMLHSFPTELLSIAQMCSPLEKTKMKGKVCQEQ